ncbi:hypothetical protein [Nonomuraea sp. bgisy101]|uniref:hypothetical protein n=1 Tax=Nonomuraea sp. bgisy101 TaxID=3413784 RepID=UPI003D716A2B
MTVAHRFRFGLLDQLLGGCVVAEERRVEGQPDALLCLLAGIALAGVGERAPAQLDHAVAQRLGQQRKTGVELAMSAHSLHCKAGWCDDVVLWLICSRFTGQSSSA